MSNIERNEAIRNRMCHTGEDFRVAELAIERWETLVNLRGAYSGPGIHVVLTDEAASLKETREFFTSHLCATGDVVLAQGPVFKREMTRYTSPAGVLAGMVFTFEPEGGEATPEALDALISTLMNYSKGHNAPVVLLMAADDAHDAEFGMVPSLAEKLMEKAADIQVALRDAVGVLSLTASKAQRGFKSTMATIG